MSRLSIEFSRLGLDVPRDPDAICRAIRFAYRMLIALAAGMGAWLLFQRI